MKPQGNELTTQYNVSIKKCQYSRSNYYIETNENRRVIRKVAISKEQIAFEYEIIEAIIKKGFDAINAIYLTKKNMPYATYQDKCYIMQGYEDNEEVDFKNKEDLIQTVVLLAQFHKVAQHIKWEGRNIEKSGIKNIYEHFYKRCTEGEKLKKSLSNLSQKSQFERMFLQDYAKYNELEHMALEEIDTKICDKLIKVAKENETIIHSDYNYHTVSKTKENKYFINTMDNCTYNVQILDLASALTKVMQKNNWDIRLLQELIIVYDKHKTLTPEEVKVLKAMLIFPEKYAGICQKYIYSKRRGNYNMFELKWENMLEYKDAQFNAASQIKKYL